jgi:hypothetical protein
MVERNAVVPAQAAPLLTYYEAAKKALAQARSVDDAKDIHDKAEALRAYARQRNDIEMEICIAEIKLRAVRRIGELSGELEKAPHGPGRGKKTKTVATAGKSFKGQTLRAAGITSSVAHRAEKVASIPEKTFDDYIRVKRERNEPVSVSEVITKVVMRQRMDEALKKFPAASPDPAPQYSRILQPKRKLLDRMWVQSVKLDHFDKFQLILFLLDGLQEDEISYRFLIARLIEDNEVGNVLHRLQQLSDSDGFDFIEALSKTDPAGSEMTADDVWDEVEWERQKDDAAETAKPSRKSPRKGTQRID